MGTFSDAAKNEMLNVTLDGDTPTFTGEVWAKLHIGAPGAAGTANPAAETDRVQLVLAAASAGVITTSAETRWDNVSNSETYSDVTFWDASTGGNFIGQDDLPAPVAVVAGNNFFIPAGDIDLSL
jgi:hypothetical protein